MPVTFFLNGIKGIAEIFRVETAKEPYFQKWNKKTALNKIKNSFKNDDIYIVISDNKMAGFITSSIAPNNKRKAHIDEFWLRKDYQRKGYGKALINHIEELYKLKGVKIMQVVSNRHSGAFKFYKKLGYGRSKELAFIDKKLR